MMDAPNRLDFGFDSGMNANSFDYAGDGMDRGLPDFPIQFPGRSDTSTVEGNITSVCTTTDVFAWLPRSLPQTQAPTKHPRR